MRQFDVYANPSSRSLSRIPYVVLLQSHLLAATPTAVIAPMLLADGRSAYTLTSTIVDFSGGSYIVSVAELLATDARLLKDPLGSLRDYEDALRRALDRLFTGF